MIKLSNAFVVANTSNELDLLREQLGTSYPEFLFEIVDNTGEEKDSFPFKMLVSLDTSIPDVSVPAMPEFYDLLLAKIGQLNQNT